MAQPWRLKVLRGRPSTLLPFLQPTALSRYTQIRLQNPKSKPSTPQETNARPKDQDFTTFNEIQGAEDAKRCQGYMRAGLKVSVP